MDHGRQYPVYPLGCVYVIGFPLALFHQGQTPHLLECESCGEKFKRRTTLAKVNLALLILVLAVIVGFLVWGFQGAWA
jgi:hypothetical protein